ncbi:HlyD family secretion protein [Poseidonibacter antarcticus]|uniref:HlyD family secretion protein n=1 Tax=Poseidonibacter antarcticus TaxID=2478538 RepID=UPI000EF4F3E4|nr:efflux RND transporter periplasmic adaptor subunit [Poseidonibacter antarcticus]
MKKIIYLILIVIVAIGAKFAYDYMNKPSALEGFAFGNGRIETTQVDISTKLPGRLESVLVKEGDMVKKGDVLARLDSNELNAKLSQAKAQVEQTKQQKNYALALVRESQSTLNYSKKNLARAKALYIDDNIPLANLQESQTAVERAKAALEAAKVQVISADASIKAAQAQVKTIQVNIDDSTLYSPINGRVLYRLVEEGEVVGSGGKILSVLELTDTFMTIFLPTSQAGLVDIGSKARIVLDALPNLAIPATVSFISPQAQFTPKEIETQSEREKLMFRVKVKINPLLLSQHLKKIKTGLPGIAYIRLDETKPWPQMLSNVAKIK